MSGEVIEAMAHEMYDIDVDRPIASPGEIDVYRPWMQRVLRAALEEAGFDYMATHRDELKAIGLRQGADLSLLRAAGIPTVGDEDE